MIALLATPGIGNRRAQELIRLFGSLDAVFAAPAGEIASALKVPVQVGRATVRTDKARQEAAKSVERLEAMGGRIVTIWDDGYPSRLKDIADPPVVLYMKGLDSPLFHYAVAVVGTRAPSEHGRRMAVKIATELAASGVTVVSGMAMGVDSLAHEGALKAGGRTIAVLGSGLDVIYPPPNRNLFERIVQQGAAISEYAPGTEPEQHHFPQRNRIIAGISLGTVIVEAGVKSGALITAGLALEQGRELFAVPGPAALPRSTGVNRLIRDGAAHLVENGAEVMEHLRSQLAPIMNVAATLAVPQLEGMESAIYTLLEQGPLQIDDLIRRSGVGAVDINRLLTTMQLKGLIQRHPGARVGRA